MSFALGMYIMEICGREEKAMSDIEEILCAAKAAGASDVHLVAGASPRMRIDGRLAEMDYPRLTASDTLDILLKIMSELQREKFEERGAHNFAFSVPGCCRCRVSAYRQQGSAAFAVRLLGTGIPTPEELGLPDAVAGLYQSAQGLALVVGPVGGGKSVTLAAILDKINSSRSAHIITLENPIEYLYQNKMSIVSQREVGVDCSDYAAALRDALREDPDVIMLGELCEAGAAEAAIAAAEAGVLVLAAVTAVGAEAALDGIVNLFPTDRQHQIRMRLAEALLMAVSQRLVPAADGEGRTAAYEVMCVDSQVRRLIREYRRRQLSEGGGVAASDRK